MRRTLTELPSGRPAATPVDRVRSSFEPTIGMNKHGTAFMTTASFDVAGNLASTEVHSRTTRPARRPTAPATST